VRFTPRALPGGDPAAYVERSLRAIPRRYDARVTLHAPAEEMRERRWLGGTIEPIDERSCEYRASDDELDWLAMRIAFQGVEFTVHEPPELIERMRDISGRIARGAGTFEGTA
jgi:predicted DNA-binding transcriptional regulator YafY